MLQANLLLPTAGRSADSFVTLDLMRLPLGILSGVGFLGAGTIIRRPNLVVGVTTAAILWIATVIGLCFGGGEIGLGIAATVLGLLILWVLKWPEQYIRQDRQATFILGLASDGPSPAEIAAAIQAAGYRIANEAIAYEPKVKSCRLQYDVRWRARRIDSRPPDMLAELANRHGVTQIRWNPEGFADA